MTVRDDLDRVDRSTFRPMLHLWPVGTEFFFLQVSPKTIYVFDIENDPPPVGSHITLLHVQNGIFRALPMSPNVQPALHGFARKASLGYDDPDCGS